VPICRHAEKTAYHLETEGDTFPAVGGE